MPVRYLSDPELARLSGWPDEIADSDAVSYFTLDLRADGCRVQLPSNQRLRLRPHEVLDQFPEVIAPTCWAK